VSVTRVGSIPGHESIGSHPESFHSTGKEWWRKWRQQAVLAPVPSHGPREQRHGGVIYVGHCKPYIGGTLAHEDGPWHGQESHCYPWQWHGHKGIMKSDPDILRFLRVATTTRSSNAAAGYAPDCSAYVGSTLAVCIVIALRATATAAFGIPHGGPLETADCCGCRCTTP